MENNVEKICPIFQTKCKEDICLWYLPNYKQCAIIALPDIIRLEVSDSTAIMNEEIYNLRHSR